MPMLSFRGSFCFFQVKAKRERENLPLDERMKQFRDLLTEKDISAFSTWEKELHKIVFDPRYLLLTSKERKTVFEKYVRERADEVRKKLPAINIQGFFLCVHLVQAFAQLR